MRAESATAQVAGPRTHGPRLILVPRPAPARRAGPRERLAAVLAGLLTGFVLAAVAAVAGGGSPTAALTTAGAIATLLGIVLVRARIAAVRARRRRRAAPGARRTAARAPIRRAA